MNAISVLHNRLSERDADDGSYASSERHSLETWEDEGGTLAGAVAEIDLACVELTDNSGGLENLSDIDAKDYDAQTLETPTEEDWILRCLGAAVVMRWNTLPKKLQRKLFDDASAVKDPSPTGTQRGRLARFLHQHKDNVN